MEQNLTKEIFELTCPYDNPYQGKDKRLLFVCSAGLLRSATGANLFAKKGYNTRSCGSEDYALTPISVNLITWAHRIYFMKRMNYEDTKAKFRDAGNGVVLEKLKDMTITNILDIPDSFGYNDPKLIKLLEEKVQP